MPSGSFKDRGAQVMVARALELQFDEVVVDSSGNAAAALAAHAARAGLKCSVFVPLATSANKIRQIEAYGASVHLVPGPRDQSRRAAETYATQRGAMYASHAQNPYFLDGTKSWFYEVVAAIPSVETVVLPVGNGSLLLGVIRAVHELLASGWIRRAPALVLAQAEGYASLNGVHSFDGVSEQHPLAEGIAIRNPPRRAQMLELLSTFDASVRVLESQEVLVAQQELARGGFYVEPTSAAAWAAWRAVENTGETVVALTGHGLKTAA
jgi:threonine synthase